MPDESEGNVGFWEVVAIGVGGMVGGGIFAVLGLAVKLAHGGTPLAFLVAGIVALLTAYSYSKLSVRYPSEGGTVEFINQAFGRGMVTGSLNVLLWLSYVVMLSLYSFAFGSYASSYFSGSTQVLVKHAGITGVILLFTVLNFIGSNVVGRAEQWIVTVKVSILLFFSVAGIWSIEASRIAPSNWVSAVPLLAGGMIIFVAYEGFELIANTAGDVKNRDRTLPRAYFTSVIFVVTLYVVIALITVGNLPVAKIVASKDYALAVVAKPFLGQFGFILITVAALLATSSAVNATLYGASRVSYIIARDGELPAVLEKKMWHRHNVEGLFITAGVTLFVANLFPLQSISTMGSAGFLILFSAVNLANVILSRETSSIRWLSLLGFLVSTGALVALVWQTLREHPHNIWVLVVMLGISALIEGSYRLVSRRDIIPRHDRSEGTRG